MAFLDVLAGIVDAVYTVSVKNTAPKEIKIYDVTDGTFLVTNLTDLEKWNQEAHAYFRTCGYMTYSAFMALGGYMGKRGVYERIGWNKENGYAGVYIKYHGPWHGENDVYELAFGVEPVAL